MLSLSGCATLTNGALTGFDQTLQVTTSPSGALCRFDRDGELLGTVFAPGTVHVSHSHLPITITCDKPGYEPVVGTDAPVFRGVMIGNAIYGGAAGVIVDAALSSDFAYRDIIRVTFADPEVAAFRRQLADQAGP